MDRSGAHRELMRLPRRRRWPSVEKNGLPRGRRTCVCVGHRTMRDGAPRTNWAVGLRPRGPGRRRARLVGGRPAGRARRGSPRRRRAGARRSQSAAGPAAAAVPGRDPPVPAAARSPDRRDGRCRSGLRLRPARARIRHSGRERQQDARGQPRQRAARNRPAPRHHAGLRCGGAGRRAVSRRPLTASVHLGSPAHQRHHQRHLSLPGDRDRRRRVVRVGAGRRDRARLRGAGQRSGRQRPGRGGEADDSAPPRGLPRRTGDRSHAGRSRRPRAGGFRRRPRSGRRDQTGGARVTRSGGGWRLGRARLRRSHASICLDSWRRQHRRVRRTRVDASHVQRPRRRPGDHRRHDPGRRRGNAGRRLGAGRYLAHGWRAGWRFASHAAAGRVGTCGSRGHPASMPPISPNDWPRGACPQPGCQQDQTAFARARSPRRGRSSPLLSPRWRRPAPACWRFPC